MKALTVVLQTFNVCCCMAWSLDTMTLDLSDTGLWWLRIYLDCQRDHA